MNPYSNSGTPVNLTATASLRTTNCRIIGFYVNSTSSGTLVFRSGAQGSSSGAAISGTITPAIGYHPFPAECPDGAHVTVGATINVTIFVA